MVSIHQDQQQLIQSEGELIIGTFTRPEYHPSFDPADMSHAERFEVFHAANPWVCEALEHLARLLINKGVTRIGVKFLYERLRWEWLMSDQEDTGKKDFHLNNSFTAYYARLLIDRNEGWGDLIETRTLTSV